MSKIRWFLFGSGMYDDLALIVDQIGKFSSGSEETLFLFPLNGICEVPDQITRFITEFKKKNSDITVHVIPFIESEEDTNAKGAFQEKEPDDQDTSHARVRLSKADIPDSWSDINEGQTIECCCDKLFFFYQSSDVRILLPNTVAHSEPQWTGNSDKVLDWLDEWPSSPKKDGLLFSAYPPEKCVVPWRNLYTKLDEKGYGLWMLAQPCSPESTDPVQCLYANTKNEELLWAINTMGDRSCMTGCYTTGKNGKAHWIVDAFIIDEQMRWTRYSWKISGRQSSKESNFPRFLGSKSQLETICAQEMESILQSITYPVPKTDTDGNPGVERIYFSYFDSPIVSMVGRDSVVNLLERMLLRYVSHMDGFITVRSLDKALATDLKNNSQKFDNKYLIVLTDDSALQAGIFQSPLDTCEAMVKQKKIMTRFVIVRSSLEEPHQIDEPLCGTPEFSIACSDAAVSRSIGSYFESCTYENPLKRDDNDDVNIHHSSSRLQEDTHEMTVQYLISNAQKRYTEEAGSEKFLDQEERNGR